MRDGNPNASNNPFAQTDYRQSRQMNGSSNPYGYGFERVAGQVAPQFNSTGMGGATNSSPFAPSTRGYDPSSLNRTPQTAAPLDYAYQTLGLGGGMTMADWIAQLIQQGQAAYAPSGYLQTTPDFYQQSLGWIPTPEGHLFNTTTSASAAPQNSSQYAALNMGLGGNSRYVSPEGRTYVSGWGPSASNVPMATRPNALGAMNPAPTPAPEEPAAVPPRRGVYGY